MTLYLREAFVEVVKEGFLITIVRDIDRSVEDAGDQEQVAFDVDFQIFVRKF